MGKIKVHLKNEFLNALMSQRFLFLKRLGTDKRRRLPDGHDTLQSNPKTRHQKPAQLQLIP